MYKPCPICSSNDSILEGIIKDFELVKCNVCNFVYANIEDAYILDRNSNYGEKSVTAYQEIQSFLHELWFRRIVKKFSREMKPGRVLDVGCGNGLLLKKFIDEGWIAHDVDVSPWSKDYASRYGFKHYQSEIEKADINSNYFDLVLSTSTLEHIAQPYSHVREIIRVLKPGGIAYLSGIPNYGKILRGQRIFYIKNSFPSHVNYFSVISMRNLFSQLDIVEHVESLIVKPYGIPYLHVLYGMVKKNIRNIFEFFEKESEKSDTVEEMQSQLIGGKSSVSYDKVGDNLFSLPRNALGKIFIEMNYLLGRHRNLGDKLEVIVVKK